MESRNVVGPDGDSHADGSASATRSVVVVGGGLIGLTAAYFLERQGIAVTVLERERVGGGASRGNAGLVCPTISDPLPAPGVIHHSLAGLFRADSPLFIDPRAVPSMAGFLIRFARRTTPAAYERGRAALGRAQPADVCPVR